MCDLGIEGYRNRIILTVVLFQMRSWFAKTDNASRGDLMAFLNLFPRAFCCEGKLSVIPLSSAPQNLAESKKSHTQLQLIDALGICFSSDHSKTKVDIRD